MQKGAKEKLEDLCDFKLTCPGSNQDSPPVPNESQIKYLD
jgi:hypothetical protein